MILFLFNVYQREPGGILIHLNKKRPVTISTKCDIMARLCKIKLSRRDV